MQEATEVITSDVSNSIEIADHDTDQDAARRVSFGEAKSFVAWRYPNGLLRTCVDCSGDSNLDDVTLHCFHEFSGVEAGPSEIFAAEGDAEIIMFAGTYEEQLEVFRQWIYDAARQRLIEDGVPELEASHQAADMAVKIVRWCTRVGRKVKREAKYGPDDSVPHRLTRAEAKRIAWAVRSELGRLRIARVFEAQGFTPQEIAEIMGEPKRAKETTAARARRRGWSAGREATVSAAEQRAIKMVRGWYGKPATTHDQETASRQHR